MRYKIPPVMAGFFLSCALPVHAVDLVSLQKTSFKTLENKFTVSLPGDRSLLASKRPDSLNYLKQRTDRNQVTHIRLQQNYEGFPVFGGYAIIHTPNNVRSLSSSASAVKINGMVYEGLGAELGKAPENFSVRGEAALQQFKQRYAGLDLQQAQVTPMVFVDEDNKAHWAYQVSVKIIHTDKIPERPTAIVDAQSLKTLVSWNNIKTAEREPVSGMGFGGNHKTGEYAYGTNLPLLNMTREAKKCFLENENVRVVDMKHREKSDNKAMSFHCKHPVSGTTDTYWTGYKGDGFDRFNDAYSPSNDAFYAGYVIQNMYRDWYDMHALQNKDGSAMQLIMRVHYGKQYENAYWDGEVMTYGDGDTMMYPLVSLDVGAHEVSHGFTEQHSDLMYYGQSGGINEAFSDMAAIAAQYYAGLPLNWMIGGDIMKEDSGYEALRYMDVPSRDGYSIDRADQYYQGIDVHFSSGVFNRLYYLMSTSEGWNPRKAFDVMVKANADYWGMRSNFVDAACGVLHAAQDLGYPLSDIKKALDEVAVEYTYCAV